MATKWVIKDKKKAIYWPSEKMKKKANMSDASIYKKALNNPKKFWSEKALEALDWSKKWNKVYESKPPFFKWFLGGKLNASYNCIDRHVENGNGDKEAIIWIPEPTNEKPVVLTYKDLLEKVSRFANVLKSFGVKKGDRVGIYLPMVSEVQIALLACARIGAVHGVVFSAFSAESLNDRLNDANAKVLITANGYYRKGKLLDLKKKADQGAKGSPVKKVIVIKRGEVKTKMSKGRDYWFHELMEKADPECKPAEMNSESPLFILYTSGTTGKPKGVIHDTGGYLTYAYWTSKWIFDLHDDDVFWCTADVGWITGHTYACYGPLACGATQVIYEGAPNYPDWSRFWKIVEENQVSVFYTAPTAIRMFAKQGVEFVKKHNLNSLRVLGSVGEPIDKDAWMWYFNHIGNKRCPIVDTWWQTETGGIQISALPGIGPFIPTVAGRPFPGTNFVILDESRKEVKKNEGGYLIQKPPFAPGMLRGVWGNPKRYEKTYFSDYGNKLYFTSDGAKYFDKNNIRVTGRVDDTMKVAGHRLTTGELEDAIATYEHVSECAVVPEPDKIRGQVPVAFVVLKGVKESEKITEDIIKQVIEEIGPTAKPKQIIFVNELPKTRSGKIMRRILKKLVINEPIGNTMTLQNPESIADLKKKTNYKRK
ncbi:MAG: acetate--CoA ligase [Candidatus Diapherotrites archaeon]|uniref:Acetate--CoA ligase n=1 Tax=Candidatus Iainarchaeum sp. TaxID=3101447 RepID=A0A2D6LPP6_9ARCH|nr:acetate--CoA ligase [Candidatus Diapherotrites archaeon]|tara:strand:+ start:2039 stop:3991 length:1953 start_codon:yes stop_codon:yes gene_type:complete